MEATSWPECKPGLSPDSIELVKIGLSRYLNAGIHCPKCFISIPPCVLVSRRLTVDWGPRVHSPAANDQPSVMGQPSRQDYGLQVSPPTIPDACPAIPQSRMYIKISSSEKQPKYQTSDAGHRNLMPPQLR